MVMTRTSLEMGLWTGVALVLAACSAKYPEGAIACSSASDCPAQWFCRAAADAQDRHCFSQPGASSSELPAREDQPKDAGPRDAGPQDASPRGGSPAPRPAAGSGGSARPDMAGRAADDEQEPPAAGGTGGSDEDAGPNPACEDTESDRDNCGRCGHACEIANAEADCRAGTCVFSTCAAGYANCDGDPANGCETTLDSAADCGACGSSCETDSEAIRACSAGSCSVLQLAVGEPEPVGAVRGSLGGDVYTHMCPPGEVITGLELAVSQSVTYGFSAKCSAVSLTGTWDAPQIVVGPAHLSPVPVGGFANSVIEQADCPANTVVTGTSGSLIEFSGETRKFIKTVLLACSRVSRLTPSLVFVPERLVPSANSTDPGDGSYSETCGAGQVLTGFTGYAGAAVDGLQAHCSSLQLLTL